MAKSIDWVCEYRKCSTVFKRYDCYVKKGIKRFCCQSHSTLEEVAKNKEAKKGRYGLNKPQGVCKHCGDKNKIRNSKYCKQCYNINYCAKRYGLTIQDYFDILEKQHSKCAICKIEKCSTGRNFAIDHDHKSGTVRGLLCYSCNIRLGWFENKEQELKNYLQASVTQK